MNLVFFDFDDTLTRMDTTLPLGAFLAGRERRRRLPLLAFAAGLVRFRLLSNHAFKRLFAFLFLRGLAIDRVQQLAQQFHQTRLDALTDGEMLGRLRLHVAGGDEVYLVSANFACLLEPLVARWSLAGVIATDAAQRDGAYSGGIMGVACHRQEKLRRTVARFGRAAVEGGTAYGNQDDVPLLGAVRAGYLVARARPPELRERLRRWRRAISGQLTNEDLAGARTIMPYTDSVRSAPADA